MMKRSVLLFFAASIYPEETVMQAIDDYKEICHIKLIKKDGGFECVFSKSVVDLELTAKEFANYLIELVNAGGQE